MKKIKLGEQKLETLHRERQKQYVEKNRYRINRQKREQNDHVIRDKSHEINKEYDGDFMFSKTIDVYI